ncbi:MAG: AAA family ATPase, partial [Candidatus Gracilibacteria bacterium]|nr:AAA family ATPase [Candidatus Gracilibacteria bacterium]
MDHIITNYRRLLKQLAVPYQRKWYSDFSLEHRMTGIVGGRGVGKTTFLLDFLRKNYGESEKALYISADDLYFSSHSLVEVATQFHDQQAGELLVIDEIHRYTGWDQELKNIYDFFPRMKILFSGSSSIDLIKGRYDLSRRAVLRHLHGFSFREFLEFKTGKQFPALSLNDLKNPHRRFHIADTLYQTPKLLGYLKSYLKEGYYPLFTETRNYEAYRDLLMSIIDKTIYEDISSFYSLKTSSLDIFKKILSFISCSYPGSININKLAKSLIKHHTTLSNYLEMLRETKLLRYLINDRHGHALIRNAEKMYIDNPNLSYAINETIGKSTPIGTIRELFIISQLQDAGHPVFASKKGDLICEKSIFEIGGKNKKWDRLKKAENHYLIKDDIVMGEKNEIPLYL